MNMMYQLNECLKDLALLQHVLCPEHADDEGQFTALWHAMFGAPLLDDAE